MSDVKNDKEYLQGGKFTDNTDWDKAAEEMLRIAERREAEGVTAPAKKEVPRKRKLDKSEMIYSESLPDAAEYTFEFIKQNRQIVRKSMEDIDGYEQLLKEDIAVYNEKNGKVSFEEKKNLVDDMLLTFGGFKKMFVRLMHRANVIHSMTFLSGYLKDGMEEFIDKTIVEPEGIRCLAEPRCVLLTLPLLPSVRASEALIFAGRKLIPLDHVNLFGEQIDTIVGRELERKDIDLRVFGFLNISYLYVYADGISAVDNDNRDTSKVTNRICRCLHTCDAPTVCWQSFASIQTDEIPVGTYVTVTPMEDGFADPMKVVEKWKKILGNQG